MRFSDTIELSSAAAHSMSPPNSDKGARNDASVPSPSQRPSSGAAYHSPTPKPTPRIASETKVCDT